ncbi:MAG: zinc-binding dehydrogenase [Spirochaetaceae bacterium]|nr:zinc-binding dehydrogenase [Spirochaetaceae bacterium]
MPRALMAVAPRTTELVEYDEPPLGDRDVRIRSEFAAPKHGTESHAYLDDQRRLARRFHPEYRIFVPANGDAIGRPFPRRLGNMTVGTVTEVGGAVTRFKVGDRVYGHLPIRETHTVSEDGPRKSMAAGTREQELHLVPPELSPEQVVLLDPAHFALAAVRDADVRVGERVAVFGLGAIGLLIVQMALLSGAVTVYAVDPLPSRRARARRLGATACYDPAACDVGLEIKQATAGAGADVAIEVSGNYGALQDAIRAVHYSGLVVTVSNYHGPGTALHLDEEWHLTRVTVRSSMPVWGNPSRDHPLWDDRRVEETALQLMRAGRLQSDGLVHPIVPFEQSAEAYHWIQDTPDRVVKLGIRFP